MRYRRKEDSVQLDHCSWWNLSADRLQREAPQEYLEAGQQRCHHYSYGPKEQKVLVLGRWCHRIKSQGLQQNVDYQERF